MKFNRRHLLTLLVTLVAVSEAPSQNYQEQMKLIRPRPENCLIYGPITYSDQKPVTDAQISLINPFSHQVTEIIPSDINGWYLFSVRKGTVHGLLIETPGFFPYYSEFTIPVDHEELTLNRPVLFSDHLRNRYTICYVPEDTILVDDSKTVVNQLGDLLSADPSLVLWFNSGDDNLDPVRINQLTGRLIDRGIPLSRLRSGSNPPSADTMIEINISTNPGDLEFIANMPPAHLSEDGWTIQFTASRSKVGTSKFKGMDPVFEFKGKDGYYRYTYGNFPTREAAAAKLSFVKGKGYSQAFVKAISSIKKL